MKLLILFACGVLFTASFLWCLTEDVAIDMKAKLNHQDVEELSRI